MSAFARRVLPFFGRTSTRGIAGAIPGHKVRNEQPITVHVMRTSVALGK
jgi:hypothetical protein